LAGIPGASRAFRTSSCGDCRAPAGTCGDLVRDQRGTPCCPSCNQRETCGTRACRRDNRARQISCERTLAQPTPGIRKGIARLSATRPSCVATRHAPKKPMRTRIKVETQKTRFEERDCIAPLAPTGPVLARCRTHRPHLTSGR
jgi:hypothetical protein